ncbi:MAG TPA: twin-arginine translocation signal domain-containing protein, partial [Verrucomicrobiae bacterium]
MKLLSSSVGPVSRRQFLTRSAATTLWLAGGATLPRAARAAAQETNRQEASLNGGWQVTKGGTTDWFPAQVPGCIHTDLLAAGRIPDPFYRDNEKAVQWVGENDWLYRCTFEVSPDWLSCQNIRLRCAGLDTLATLRLNGQEIGRTDNMFRTWEFDAKPWLRSGENTIEILLASPAAFVKSREDMRGQNKGVTGKAWLRKQPCHFGWDWAPTLITSGIWRDITLEAWNHDRLTDTLILQDHSQTGQVKLTVQCTAQGSETENKRARLTLLQAGKVITTTKLRIQKGHGEGNLIVKRPRLWWPHGMGEQPLYHVQVDLLDSHGTVCDSMTRRIGLRTLALVEAQANQPLHFQVNGVPFFAKGANWIPADAFSNRVTPDRLRQYVADAVAVNMNMLRFWGGGYYEEDALYDACDEMGICVWADFKFACASYPAFDDAFVANVRLEVADNLKRLRHHPSIAVWCGNNEISLLVKDDWSLVSMARESYDKLFKQVLAAEVKACAPQTSYVSGSPDCGDVHYWEVWWGARTFEAYRELSGFMSEFGYQSYPEPQTVYRYTAAEDRTSTMTDIMKWHQRCPLGNDRIHNMHGNYFKPGKDFDSTLWISQMVQAYGIKLGAEYWRQQMPRSMGCLFWQYNDCWPVASWASVDYYGRWKALHYAARHFYAPVLVSGLEDEKDHSVAIYLSSDEGTARTGELRWQVTDLEGNPLQSGSQPVAIAPRQSGVAKQLDLADLAQKRGANRLLVWLELQADGRLLSRNL